METASLLVERARLVDQGPHSLRKPIEWKLLSVPLTVFGLRPAGPHSLRKPIEWKLPAQETSCSYALPSSLAEETN